MSANLLQPSSKETESWWRPPGAQKVGDLVLSMDGCSVCPFSPVPNLGGIPDPSLSSDCAPHGVHQQVGVGPPQKHVQTRAVPHCPPGQRPSPTPSSPPLWREVMESRWGVPTEPWIGSSLPPCCQGPHPHPHPTLAAPPPHYYYE